MAEKSYKPKRGDRVRVIADRPQVPPEVVFVVKIVNDPAEHPGKVIGLETSERWPGLHSLDEAVEEGRGWWTLPENLEPTKL